MGERTFTWFFSLVVFLSGIAGLSYELLWMRSVRGYFGDETLSVALIIFIYFAGLGIGGFLANVILQRKNSPLAIYAAAELLIGAFGLLLPTLLSVSYGAYLKLCGVLDPQLWLTAKIAVIFACLIVPAALIGLTLPLIAAAGISRPSFFTQKFSHYYSLNTLGAVAGILLCGIFLIPRLGLTWTGRGIVLINICVAVMLYICYKASKPAVASPPPAERNIAKAVFPAAIAFSLGLMSLSYEVAWIRVFCFYFIPSTVSLALLLGVFIAGFAIGSFALSLWKKRITVAQFGYIEGAKAVVMLGMFLAISHLFYSNWGVTVQKLAGDLTFGSLVRIQFLFASIVFLLPGIFMGMTFPLIERIWPSETAGAGRVVSLAASWNTWGGAAGAFLTGMVFIPWLGTAATLKLAILFSVVVATLLLLKNANYIAAAVLPVALVSAVLYLPGELNFSRTPDRKSSFEYYKEGRSGCVYVYKNKFNEKSLYISNTYVLGSEEFPAVRSQVRQGALPIILARKETGAVLSIGVGTGITVLPLYKNSIAREVDAVEIVPEVIEASALFAPSNGFIGTGGRVNVSEGDGREFLAHSKKKYDAIFAELYSPEFAGIGNLYSVEHLRAVRDHLTADGIFCQCIALYQFNVETFRIALRTMLEVFGKGSVWLIESDFASPTVIVASGPGAFRTAEELQAGTARFTGELANKSAWHDAVDVAVHFISDDLADLAGNEQRINSIQYPWIEELSSRLVKKGHIAEMRYLLDHRKWPEAWRGWEEGHAAWKTYGAMMDASVCFFSGDKALSLEGYLAVLHETLELSRSLNAAKSDLYKKTLIEIVPASPLFSDRDVRRAFAEKLLVKAIGLDPFNYTLDWKLFELYAGAGDEAKALTLIPTLLAKVPETFKAGGTFKDIRDFYLSRAGNR